MIKLLNWPLLKREYNSVALYKAELILHIRQKYYIYVERPSHLLALMLKQGETKASINAIRNADGCVTTDPQSINVFAAFFSFFSYSNLYKLEVDFYQCKVFVDKLYLPKLLQSDRSLLNAPLKLELQIAV